MSPLDDLPELGSFNEEVAEPLGLANPLLPPEPLGQNLLYPQFLVPIATEPLMATNPSMFFPGGIPGYQPPENPFQESPFFAAARASLRTGQVLGLPEVLPGTRRVPRPILSELLGDLEPQTDFEAPVASPEPTTNEIEVADIPTLEEEFEVVEEQEIQPVPPEEIVEGNSPTSHEVETKELIEPPPELSPLSSESSSNPLSVQAASEENYVVDASPAESIAAELSPQETELVEPPIAFSSEELGSPVVPQTEEFLEETESAVISELPEQLNNVEVTVSPEVDLSEETEIPEPITENSSPPELAEILTESAAENITPEPEPLPVTPTTASTVISDLEQTTPEPEEVPESSELTEVQSEPEVVEALEAMTPEPENTELPIEVETAVSPEGELPETVPLVPVAESAAEENESLPERTNEAPILATEEIATEEEATAEIVEPLISNPEIIAAAVEESVGEELVSSVAELPPSLAEAELTSPAEPETPPSMAVSAEVEPVEELENTEELPISEESIAVPVEVIPEGEPLAAEQNQSEEPVAATAEPLAVTTLQAMVAPETEQNSENQPESESSPPISRIQELVEQQIEAFSGLEQEEVIEEEASTAPESAVSTVIEEGAQPASGEESIPLEIPPEVVATPEMAAPSLEIPIVAETESESAPLQSNVELPVTQTEANVEAALSLPTVLENLGVLAPLSTLSPLTQLANFLPVAEPFASQRREGIPLSLEQPMTFASPPITSSISSPLTQRANFLPVPEPFASEQREGIPLGLEQPMTFASINPPPSLESSASTTPNFSGPQGESDLSPISDTSSSAADSSTGTESSISQEEHPSFSEAMSSLPVVSTLPVMRNDGIFTPLTFAPRSINNTPINEQERGFSPSLSTPDIPQQWSSIEEFINSNPSIEPGKFSSLFSPEISIHSNEPEGENYAPETSNFMSSRSFENDKEQNFIAGSTSLDDMNESNLEEDEESFLDELNEDTENEIDLEILAQEIYGLLQQRLVIERERQGFYTGRLPW